MANRDPEKIPRPTPTRRLGRNGASNTAPTVTRTGTPDYDSRGVGLGVPFGEPRMGSCPFLWNRTLTLRPFISFG